MVSNYQGFQGGTTTHLHFDLQVFTRDGWIWVNPYSTLIASYERLLGARGREIGPDLTAAGDHHRFTDAASEPPSSEGAEDAELSRTAAKPLSTFRDHALEWPHDETRIFDPTEFVTRRHALLGGLGFAGRESLQPRCRRKPHRRQASTSGVTGFAHARSRAASRTRPTHA